MQRERPLPYNQSYSASSIFHGVPGQEQGWSTAAGGGPESKLSRVKGDVLEQVPLSSILYLWILRSDSMHVLDRHENIHYLTYRLPHIKSYGSGRAE